MFMKSMKHNSSAVTASSYGHVRQTSALIKSLDNSGLKTATKINTWNASFINGTIQTAMIQISYY